MIKSYEFGKIVIGDKIYKNDILILPKGEIFSWWRNEGHYLINNDLIKIYEVKPEILVIGTGFYGFMKVDNEVEEYCLANKIKIYIAKTSEAVQIFNSEKSKNKSAALHLTC
jgi:hypothetical protein